MKNLRQAAKGAAVAIAVALVFIWCEAASTAKDAPIKKPELRMMSGCRAPANVINQVSCVVMIWNHSDGRRAQNGTLVVKKPVNSTIIGPVTPAWLPFRANYGKFSWELKRSGLRPKKRMQFRFNLAVPEGETCVQIVLLGSMGQRLHRLQKRCVVLPSDAHRSTDRAFRARS